jgi:DNA-binding CsgD family transcriptional regulator
MNLQTHLPTGLRWDIHGRKPEMAMISNGHADTASHAVTSRRFHEEGDFATLSCAEQLSVVRAIRICAGISTLDEYSTWLSDDLNSLLQHRGWACGLGCLHPEGYAATYWLASRGPHEQFSSSRTVSNNVVSPLLTSWLEARRPQIYIRLVDHDAASAGGNMFVSEELDNAVLHCQMDPDNKWTSVFCFANMDERPGYRQRLLLDLLVPHLHATLCRVVAGESIAHDQSDVLPGKLTAREVQILRYIRQGRTNAEIAETMHKSVFTVNNQVVKVLAKLGAKNRTQAVFVAREMGLLKS